MIQVKIKNCRHQNRSNQNTQFFFSEKEYGFGKDDIVTVDWVRKNMSLIVDDIEVQKNTKIEIERIR